MKKESMKRQIAKLLVVAGAALPLVGCVDDSYDMSKDIDLTMGLGSEGLELRLGSTEKIMLADILETDESLKTQEGTNLYYLVEENSTAIDFDVAPLSFNLDNSVLEPNYEVLNLRYIAEHLLGLTNVPNFSITIPAWDTPEAIAVSAEGDLNYEVTGIDPAVKWVKELKAAENTQIKFFLYIEQSENLDFKLKDVNNLKVKFPDYLKLSTPQGGEITEEEGQAVFSFNDIPEIGSTSIEIGSATLDCLALGEDGKIEGDALKIEGKKISMSGELKLSTGGGFEMGIDDKVTLHMHIYVGERGPQQSRINIASVTGRFSPTINPAAERIDVGGELPDFLQDESVTIKVANPTLKLSADMTDIPASLNIGAQLTAEKNNEVIADVTIPSEGDTAIVKTGTYNNIYFYQDETTGPFDLVEVPESASRYPVSTLGTLIEKIPDFIEVKLDDNRIHFRDEDCTIKMGHTYNTTIGYKLLVPFAFNEGLRIVYTDSVTDMHKDLKDFAAEGLEVKAEILNAVPLQLNATLEPLDTKGNIIESIDVTPVTIAPASVTGEEEVSTVKILLTLNNPNDLKKVDALRFRVTAEGVQSGGVGALRSDQYIEVKDMRLKLKGQVIGDFNDDDE